MHSTHNKTLILLILFVFSTFQVFAQLTFEKGYFIDNEGNKTEGFIENHDWKYNPITFYFRSSASAEKEKKIIHNIQEFGIYDKVKFQREYVELDRSSGSKIKVEENSKPEFDFENSRDIVVVKNLHLNVGAGILIQNRLSIEGNLWFNRHLSLFLNSFNTYSLILGYRLF